MSNKDPKDATGRPIEDAELVEQSDPGTAPPEDPAARDTPNNSKFQVILPFLAGGVLAGGLGFGAAVLPAYLNPSDPLAPIVSAQDTLAKQLAEQETQIKQIEAKPAPKDHSATLIAMTEAIDALRRDIDQRQTKIETQLQALTLRLEEVEKQPLAQSVSPQAIKAYESELAQLRSNLAQVVQSASAQIEQTKAKAEELQMTTDASTRTGTITAALNAIRAAAKNGAGYEAALSDLISATEIDLPEALQAHAKNGVAQLGGLQDRFLPAARAALKDTSGRGASDGGEPPARLFESPIWRPVFRAAAGQFSRGCAVARASGRDQGRSHCGSFRTLCPAATGPRSPARLDRRCTKPRGCASRTFRIVQRPKRQLRKIECFGPSLKS